MKILSTPNPLCDLDALSGWLKAPRVPVLLADESPGAELLLACLRREAIDFIYNGGSAPGSLRRVLPTALFTMGDGDTIYLSGFCSLRQAERLFRVDRIRLC